MQTEDRGGAHAKIDTAVYLRGRVIYRHSSGYKGTHAAEAGQVEEQHRHIIESLRAGKIVFDDDASRKPESLIAIGLMNPKTWMAAGHADLHLEVRERGHGRAPVAGARIAARFEGATEAQTHNVQTDAHGRAQIRFPLPADGVGGKTLVIRASAETGEDEIRFHLRAKSKTPVSKP